jgi:hypothetical protein
MSAYIVFGYGIMMFLARRLEDTNSGYPVDWHLDGSFKEWRTCWRLWFLISQQDTSFVYAAHRCTLIDIKMYIYPCLA